MKIDNQEEFEEKTKYYAANVEQAIDKVVSSNLSIKQIKWILRGNPALSKEAREQCIEEVKRQRAKQ